MIIPVIPIPEYPEMRKPGFADYGCKKGPGAGNADIESRIALGFSILHR